MKTARTDSLLVVLSFAILALSPLACGSGQDRDLTDVCRRICDKFGYCNSDMDSADGCTQRCMMEQGMSLEYLSSMAGCMDILSCDRIDNGQLPECALDRLEHVHPPSTSQRRACETISQTVSVCDGLSEREIFINCIKYTSACISENLLVALEACYFGSCDKIDACVTNVITEYHIIFEYYTEDALDIFLGTLGLFGEGSDGGGGSGGGGTNDSVCNEVLDRMTRSLNELCGDLYDFCCVCICWNHNQVVTYEDEEYCYCGDPPGEQVELAMNEECEGDVLAWATDVLESESWEEETEDFIISQCSSGDGGGDSNDCRSTGRLKCSSGYLWALLECDDGTEQLSSENFYECPCGCYHGSSYCKSC